MKTIVCETSIGNGRPVGTRRWTTVICLKYEFSFRAYSRDASDVIALHKFCHFFISLQLATKNSILKGLTKEKIGHVFIAITSIAYKKLKISLRTINCFLKRKTNTLFSGCMTYSKYKSSLINHIDILSYQPQIHMPVMVITSSYCMITQKKTGRTYFE